MNTLLVSALAMGAYLLLMLVWLHYDERRPTAGNEAGKGADAGGWPQ
ncbi:hypothetical protein [Allosalinactinospora lopnorensis]|nr:hypothetical protein [Allosalinactinospora lopnorensis]